VVMRINVSTSNYFSSESCRSFERVNELQVHLNRDKMLLDQGGYEQNEGGKSSTLPPFKSVEKLELIES